MSKVVKGVKKAVKKVGKFVKKHWKTIALVGLAAFGAGIAIGGWGNFMSMAKAGTGFWGKIGTAIKATGSVMKAGVTGTLGTLGIGGGASGAYASAAGMQGATLMTGAAAQSMGIASQGIGGAGAAANVGTYTGPGASFMGGNGSLFGGAAGAPPAALPPQSLMSNELAGTATRNSLAPLGGVPPSTVNMAGSVTPTATGGSLVRDLAVAAAPSLIQGAGAYMAARGEEEAAKPRALWGYDIEGGTGYEGYQPQQVAQTVTGPDGQQYESDGRGGWRPAFGLQPVGLMGLQGGFA